MATSITVQTLKDGVRRATLKAHIVEGGSELTDGLLVDVSALSGSPSAVSIEHVESYFSGFSALLEWDATTDVPILQLPDGESIFDFRNAENTTTGRLINNAGTGVTGDILVTTTGLGTGEQGTIIITVVKKGAIV